MNSLEDIKGNILSVMTTRDIHNIMGISNVMLEKNGVYFFIEDETEKISDVSVMPEYIQTDWVNYSKKPLTLSILDKHIRFQENICNDEVVNNLLAIRRDFIINSFK